MKTKKLPVYIYAVLLSLVCIFSFSQGAEPTAREKENGGPEGILKVVLQKETFDIGERIKVSLILTNTSDKPISIMMTNPFSDYRIETRDSNGVKLPLTEYGEQMHKQSSFFWLSWKTLAPGESIKETVDDLSGLVKLDKSGKYSLTAWRNITVDEGKQGKQSHEIKSNSVAFALRIKP